MSGDTLKERLDEAAQAVELSKVFSEAAQPALARAKEEADKLRRELDEVRRARDKAEGALARFQRQFRDEVLLVRHDGYSKFLQLSCFPHPYCSPGESSLPRVIEQAEPRRTDRAECLDEPELSAEFFVRRRFTCTDRRDGLGRMVYEEF